MKMPNVLLPMPLGKAADLLYKIRQQRFKVQHDADTLRELENQLKTYIIDELPKSKAEGIAGKTARVQVKKSEQPVCKDWSKFWDYVQQTGSFDLVQRRLSPPAVRARLDNGEDVPGVESVTIVDVSLTKL